MRVDEAGHHRHGTEITIRRARRSTRPDRSHHTVRNLNPAGPQQFSARE
jgi:hypothetical protein